jgi:hypothetical protein
MESPTAATATNGSAHVLQINIAPPGEDPLRQTGKRGERVSYDPPLSWDWSMLGAIPNVDSDGCGGKLLLKSVRQALLRVHGAG